MPDGAICCVGLGITLESVLFQLRAALGLAGARNARGNDLLRRLRDRTQLRPITVERLQAIFSEDSLSMRDALAHGAFFANEEIRVEGMVSGLSWALADLMQDVQAAGTNLGPHRWDAGRSLGPVQKLILICSRRYGVIPSGKNRMSIEVNRLHCEV